jgi:hypothetical protein
MKTVKPLEKYFDHSLKTGKLRFTLDKSWLTVELKTPNGATPSKDGYKYTLLCAHDISGYRRPLQLVNRITEMLIENLSQARQDVSIFYEEYEPKRGRRP